MSGRYLASAILLSFLSLAPARIALADSPPAARGPLQTIELGHLVEQVGSANFKVLENALRVYQAREAITVARGNLLPRLNLWGLLGSGGGGRGGMSIGILGVIEDVAPFLVPANWFRVKESRVLYLAEKEGYRALWGNELMTAKGLFFRVLQDQTILSEIDRSRRELEEILVIVQSRELLGGAPQGTSRNVEIRILSLLEDLHSMEALIAEELGMLTLAMGIPAETGVQLASIPIPDIGKLEKLTLEDFEFRALDAAPEVRQFGYLIDAADYVRGEVLWSFLGVSTLARGAAGGVFDSLPIQPGLGFGTGASMRIVQAQKEILRTQQRGVEELIRRQLRSLITSYNLDIEHYSNLKRRYDLSRAALGQLYERLRLGQEVDGLELIDASRNQMQAAIGLYSVHYHFLATEDGLSRLIFHGDYSRSPAILETIRERKSS